jgi:hypothetical protein
MDSLMHSKQPEKVGGRLVRCGATFPFPERRTEIIPLG